VGDEVLASTVTIPLKDAEAAQKYQEAVKMTICFCEKHGQQRCENDIKKLNKLIYENTKPKVVDDDGEAIDGYS
jgi:hypothetical protein